MTFISELFFFFKKNFFLLLIYSILLSLFLIGVNIFSAFNYKIDFLAEQTSRNYLDKNMYSLMDDLQDPDEFSTFSKQEDTIDKIWQFYTLLNNESSFTYLPIYDQHLPIHNFKGDITFDYTYDAEMDVKGHYNIKLDGKQYHFLDAKSIQLNQKSFEFYSLEVEHGKSFSWDTIAYNQRKLPIILGSNYKNIYNIGDRLIGDFSSQMFEFEVIGFLKKNTFIFYQGNAEHYLDDYIVLPYPTKKPAYTSESRSFVNYVLFDMINGNIAVDQNMSLHSLLATLNKIGKQANFTKYQVLGISNFVEKYSNMFIILTHNKKILLVLFCCLFIALLIVLHFISYFLFKRRQSVYHVYLLNGSKPRFISTLLFWEIGLPIFGSVIFYSAFLFQTRIENDYSILLAIGISLLIFATTAVMLSFLLKNKQRR